MKNYHFLIAFVLLSFSLAGCWNSGPDPTKEYNEDPTQNGTPEELGMTDDYSNTNRVIWQKPELVLDRMGDITDKGCRRHWSWYRVFCISPDATGQKGDCHRYRPQPGQLYRQYPHG
nr:hypothetical protein [Haliscomenobacter sp.]